MKKLVLLASALLVGLYSCKKDSSSNNTNPTNPGLTSCFSASKTLVDSGEVINFTNCSKNAATYYWTFDGGSPSTVANPSISYKTRGNYVIRLTTTDASTKYTKDSAITVTVGYRAISNIAVTKLNVTAATKVYVLFGPVSNQTQYHTDTISNYTGGAATFKVLPGNIKIDNTNNTNWLFRVVKDDGSGPQTIITFGSATKVYPSRGPSPIDLGSTTNNIAALNYIIIK